jgi:hypothetical protein
LFKKIIMLLDEFYNKVNLFILNTTILNTESIPIAALRDVVKYSQKIKVSE